jgi:hypothetical protein
LALGSIGFKSPEELHWWCVTELKVCVILKLLPISLLKWLKPRPDLRELKGLREGSDKPLFYGA